MEILWGHFKVLLHLTSMQQSDERKIFSVFEVWIGKRGVVWYCLIILILLLVGVASFLLLSRVIYCVCMRTAPSSIWGAAGNGITRLNGSLSAFITSHWATPAESDWKKANSTQSYHTLIIQCVVVSVFYITML